MRSTRGMFGLSGRLDSQTRCLRSLPNKTDSTAVIVFLLFIPVVHQDCVDESGMQSGRHAGRQPGSQPGRQPGRRTGGRDGRPRNPFVYLGPLVELCVARTAFIK